MSRASIEDLPVGARFYRCAFQVNPYDHVVRHNKPTSCADEAPPTNAAIVQPCEANQIEVIGPS